MPQDAGQQERGAEVRQWRKGYGGFLRQQIGEQRVGAARERQQHGGFAQRTHQRQKGGRDADEQDAEQQHRHMHGQQLQQRQGRQYGRRRPLQKASETGKHQWLSQ